MGDWDKTAWIEKKIAEKNRLKALMPIVEYNMGKSVFGECDVEWSMRVRGLKGKCHAYINSLIKKGRQIRLVENI